MIISSTDGPSKALAVPTKRQTYIHLLECHRKVGFRGWVLGSFWGSFPSTGDSRLSFTCKLTLKVSSFLRQAVVSLPGLLQQPSCQTLSPRFPDLSASEHSTILFAWEHLICWGKGSLKPQITFPQVRFLELSSAELNQRTKSAQLTGHLAPPSYLSSAQLS